MSRAPYGFGAKASAWLVHLLSANGAVLGLLALVAIGEGRFKVAWVWMAAALVVDGVDGWLARRARVAQVLPRIDGALLDNVVDYLNYVVVPAYLIHRAGLLPVEGSLAAAALICLCSAFQFTDVEAKTPDHFFKGFPSLWNAAAFYLLLLRFDPWIALTIVVSLCALCFVPVRFVHPTRTIALRRLTLPLTVLWGGSLVALFLQYPDPSAGLLYASLAYVGYYFATSLFLTAAGRP